MIEEKDIEALAKLARIEIEEDQKKGLIKDLEAVLGYVSDVQNASDVKVEHIAGTLRNVMREDANPHASGLFTKDIIAEAPSEKDGYVKVKKIL